MLIVIRLSTMLRNISKFIFSQDEAAISDYDNAIRLKPDYADVYYDQRWLSVISVDMLLPL